MNQKFVFDTHTFIWCLSETKHKFLSPKALQVFNEIKKGNAKGFISVIALAELAHLFSRDKINLSLEQALVFIKNNPSFIISAVELDHVLLMETFSDIPECMIGLLWLLPNHLTLFLSQEIELFNKVSAFQFYGMTDRFFFHIKSHEL